MIDSAAPQRMSGVEISELPLLTKGVKKRQKLRANAPEGDKWTERYIKIKKLVCFLNAE